MDQKIYVVLTGNEYCDGILRDDDSIHFVCEEDNEYDDKAIICLDHNNEKVGYVAKNPKVPQATPNDMVLNNKVLYNILNNNKVLVGETIRKNKGDTSAVIKLKEVECWECEKCKYSNKSSKDKRKCFTYEFWNEVVENKNKHFVDENNSVYHPVADRRDGGFGCTGYDITIDGHTYENYGLWHRGCAPEKVAKQLIKGTRKVHQR